MADKEFLLGNKARELLIFTNQATRVVSDDVSVKDVRKIIRRIAELDNICDVKMVCAEIDRKLEKTDREGFSKSLFRLYGEDMREIAKSIVRHVHSANNKNFQTDYQQRLDTIDKILEYIDAALMIEPKGIYYYYLAYIKYDYFERKHFRTSPNYVEALQMAQGAGLSEYDVEQLYSILGVPRPECL